MKKNNNRILDEYLNKYLYILDQLYVLFIYIIFKSKIMEFLKKKNKNIMLICIF